MLNGNLVIWSKYRQNIEKEILRKLNEFNFGNKEVEEFTSSWRQDLVNVRNPNYLK